MRTSTQDSSSDLLKLAETEGLSEEAVALLKIPAIRRRQIDQSQLTPLAEVVKRLRYSATPKSS